MEAGSGEPLIIVPATISELENWVALTQFMAQWFHALFFELPGHGKSSAFEGGFSTQKVACLIEQMANALGYKRFNLMGFSFGGILAMRTFESLSNRIDRLILISPCVDHRAIMMSRFQTFILRKFNEFISQPRIHEHFNDLIHNPRSANWIIKAIRGFGQLEKSVPLERRLPQTSRGMMNVLNAQITEIFKAHFDVPAAKSPIPCYFAMSINDPLLDFDITHNVLDQHFSNMNTIRLTYPFHQPPRQFTYEELNADFFETVDTFINANETTQIDLLNQ